MIGQTISHYKILEKLGEGGMGEVYLAEDTSLPRKVALKFLSASKVANPESRKRFLHEAKAQAMVSHPNVATFYEVGEEGEKVFIVMEYIAGQKLSELAKAEKLSLSEILDLVIQAGEGLQAAHERGVTHRDVNPTNILVTAKRVAKITDFGLAKWRGASTITGTGLQMGTDYYMSPEQVDGRKVDFRTDIFSFGVVLYELICTHRPFEGDNRDSIYYEILHTQPHPLARYCRGVPQGLEEAVSKCLAKDPDERYQSAAELVADLKRNKRKVDSGEVDFQLDRVGKRTFRRFFRAHSFPMVGAVIMLSGLLLFPEVRNRAKRFLGMRTIALTENLVILPFTNVGGDPANQAFCDGLGETVNDYLSRLEYWHPSLSIVPRSDMRKYEVYSAEEARKIFGAARAVRGSVEETDRGFRLTLHLIDSKSLRLLRSAVNDYSMADVSSLLNRTVGKLAAMLELTFPPEAFREMGRGNSTVASALAFYLRGRGYLQRYEQPGNLDKAIELFERALREDPLYGRAYAGLGEACWRKYGATQNHRWLEQAVEKCTRAVQLDERLSPARITLGKIHTGQKAVEEFQKALAFDSLNVEAYRSLADVYQALRDTSRAESTYQEAIRVRPNYPAGYSYLGAFYYRQGKYEKALSQFKRVVDLAPENYRGYNNLGGVYMQLGRSTEAAEMLELSLKIKPDYRAYTNLGNLYFFQVESYADAARAYQSALELNPTSDYTVWGSLAAAYYEVPGEQARADTAYRRAAAMAEERRRDNSQDPLLLSHLAGYYATLGEAKKAVPLLEQSLALAPTNPEILARAGEAYEQLGQREKALEWIGKALERGYSVKMLNQWPGLKKLRKDGRFLRLADRTANKLRN